MPFLFTLSRTDFYSSSQLGRGGVKGESAYSLPSSANALGNQPLVKGNCSAYISNAKRTDLHISYNF